MMPAPFVIVPIIVVVLFIIASVRIVQEYERAVIFRLGRFSRIGGPGLFLMIPWIEWSRTVDIRTVTAAIEPQETITRDSVTIKVNAVVWYRVTNPSRAVIAVASYPLAVNQVSLTSLRNIIGQHDLDEILRERDRINATLRQIVDSSTEPWGVKIEAVEMKDVEIPVSMQRAMAQEAEAVREKRARLIKAQAEFESSQKLAEASQIIVQNPAALELRRMQMVAEVGAEHNSTTVILIPSDFVSLAKSMSDMMNINIERQEHAKPRPTQPPQPPT